MTIPFFPLIGIDIGASAIKIAEFSGFGAKRKLAALGLEVLPPDAVVDGVIQDQEIVEKSLIHLMERLRLNPRGRRGAVSLGPKAVEVKRLLVDANAGELDQLVQYEAEQHFQSDINELYFEYQQLPGWSEDSSKLPILMVGAQRERVDQVIDLLRACGLRTGVIDCESLCLANIYEYSYADSMQLSAIIDVGSQMSTATLAFNGQHLFSKSIDMGGAAYTRAISQALSVELDNAEAIKLSLSMGHAAVPEPVQRVFTDLNQTFVSELHSSLKSYFDTSVPIPGVTGLNVAYLCGGGSRVLGLDAAVGAAFQIPVQHLNPFAKIQANPKQFEMDYILNQGHVFGVAAGLALRKFGDEKA